MFMILKQLSWGCLLLLWLPGSLMAQEPMPPEYQDLEVLLRNQLDTFDAKHNARWDGQKHPIAFSAEMLTVNGNRGLELLKPGTYAGVQLELLRLKALGITCVTFGIQSPLLAQSYYDGFLKPPEDYFTQFVNFYKRVASDARALGMKVLVESGPVFSMPGISDPNLRIAEYYASLTGAQYVAVRVEVLKNIAREIRPDYLQLGAEPDTEASQTGFPIGTPEAWKTFVNYALAELKKLDLTGIQLGAGIGNWTPQYLEFMRNYAETDLDCIDIHIYPVNRDFMDRAVEIADLAAAAGKKVIVAEAWLYKTRDNELGQIAAEKEMFRRDAFECWQPLDDRFLEVLVKLAHYKKFEAISPFWSKYFYAYLKYADAKDLDADQVANLSSQAAAQALVNGTYTGTGLAYRALIESVPPSPPANLTAQAPAPTRVELTWTAATDNIGVSKYLLYRDGVRIGETSLTSFADTTVQHGTPCRYTVVACDRGFNRSEPSAPADVITPTLPGYGAATPALICEDAKHLSVGAVRILRPGVRPRFSPDGQTLVFDRINADGFHDLYLMNRAGLITRALTESNPLLAQRHNGNGIFHPSGEFLVFISEEPVHAFLSVPSLGEPGLGLFNNLWAITLDGSSAWKLTAIPIKQSPSDPTPVYSTVNPHFSRDGTKLYWTERYQEPVTAAPGEPGTWGGWRVKAADFVVSDGVPALVNASVVLEAAGEGGNYVTAMGFGEDPNQLLVAGNLSGQHEFGMDQYLYDLQTGQLTNLLDTPRAWEEDASTTADGSRVVFMSNVDSAYPLDFANPSWHLQPRERDYRVMDSDGDNQERLTFFNESDAPEFLGGRSIVAASDLSPDDRQMAGTLGLDFGDETSARHLLYVITADLDGLPGFAADDEVLYASSGAFGVNWKNHASGRPADTFSLNGSVPSAGMPLSLSGIRVQLEINGFPAAPEITLDASGKGFAPTAQYRFDAQGDFSIRISKADLRDATGLSAGTNGSGLVDLAIRLRLSGGALPEDRDLFGVFRFPYTARANASIKGRYTASRDPALTGAFAVTSCKVASGRSGGHSFTLSGILRPPLEFQPLVLAASATDTDEILITVGGMRWGVPLDALRLSRGAYSLDTRSGQAPPECKRFQLTPGKHAFSLTTSELPPELTGLGAGAQDLIVRFDLSTPHGILSFRTTVGLRPSGKGWAR